MTAVDQTSSPLMTQCLDFCQALALQGRVFKFSVTVGSDFTFSLDTKETRPVKDNKTKKRISPSTKRRNAKRRAEFLSKKSPPEAAVATGLETNQKRDDLFQCDQCDSTFKTQNGLKIHKGKAHKEDSPPEKARNSPSQPALVCSPIREATRVEPCHNCGLDMSPSHQCPSDSTMHDGADVEEPSPCPLCVSYNPHNPRYLDSLPLFDAKGLKEHYQQYHPPIDF